jgi:hypothetical protein
MMGYFKSVAIDINEAVAEEVRKGFESLDEMREVFLEIAYEYNVSADAVWEIYRSADFDYC